MLQRSTPAEHSGGALRRSAPLHGCGEPSAWGRNSNGFHELQATRKDAAECSAGWFRWMVPLDGSAGWFRWMVPLDGSAAWARYMGPLHGSAAWVRCMGPLHGSAAATQWRVSHCAVMVTPCAVSAAIAPVQPLPLTVWRVSHCVVMVTPCALCFGCSLKLKRTELFNTAQGMLFRWATADIRAGSTGGGTCRADGMAGWTFNDSTSKDGNVAQALAACARDNAKLVNLGNVSERSPHVSAAYRLFKLEATRTQGLLRKRRIPIRIRTTDNLGAWAQFTTGLRPSTTDMNTRFIGKLDRIRSLALTVRGLNILGANSYVTQRIQE
jgi:hypothetical protein